MRSPSLRLLCQGSDAATSAAHNRGASADDVSGSLHSPWSGIRGWGGWGWKSLRVGGKQSDGSERSVY